MGQSNAPNSAGQQRTLRTFSRAVVVDVIVTDHKGRPVTGLKRGQFVVTEEGKPQAITYFEEHTAAQQPTVAAPKLPPDVFTNFSPTPFPPVVNVLLLDSLNTRMEDQSFVHRQAMDFLQTAKPGSRIAIFAMSRSLRFVQGFTDDPTLLAAALGSKRINEVQSPDLMKSKEETNAQKTVIAMGAQLQEFFNENDDSRSVDRALITLVNLQRLATFLGGFPGRKNVIWFTESVPWIINGLNQQQAESVPWIITTGFNQQLDAELEKTFNMLAASRVALYPVDARGISTTGFYQADNVLPPTTKPEIGPHSPQTDDIREENQQRDSDQLMLEKLAHDTGGRAFLNSNGLSAIIADITSSSSDFYSLSYTPSNAKMDGSFRKMNIKISNAEYNLSYRPGYFARAADLPATSETQQKVGDQKTAALTPYSIDPLRPFMDLGMPQAQQILYEALIRPMPQKDEASPPGAKSSKDSQLYSVDFAVDLSDLDLKQNSNGNRTGKLNLSLIAYDRYAQIIRRNDQIISLDIKPDIYVLFGTKGVQVHTEIDLPHGQYWLRTGIYDQSSRKVGTMEIPLNSVSPLGGAPMQ